MAACFSLKRSPWSLSGLPVRRKSPPPPLALARLSPEDRRLRPLHLSAASSSSAKRFLSTVDNKVFPPRRGGTRHECSCSADHQERLDYLFFKPTHYDLERSILKVVMTVAYYCVYTINAKMFLNKIPCPLLLSAGLLAAGSFFMLLTWGSARLCRDATPQTDLPFWKSLFPVAVAHTVGFVAEIISLSNLSMPSTCILMCAEPLFTVLLSDFFGGHSFPLPVRSCLLPIVGGCALFAFTKHDMNIRGFIAAMIASFAFACRDLLSERRTQLTGKKATCKDYFGCLSIMSLSILAPFALAIEGPRMWATCWKMALSKSDLEALLWLLVSMSVHYQFYNEEAYRFFPNIEPFPFITVNTAKKFFIIITSLICLRTPIQPTAAEFGAGIAIYGIFHYSRAMCETSKIKSWYL